MSRSLQQELVADGIRSARRFVRSLVWTSAAQASLELNRAHPPTGVAFRVVVDSANRSRHLKRLLEISAALGGVVGANAAGSDSADAKAITSTQRYGAEVLKRVMIARFKAADDGPVRVQARKPTNREVNFATAIGFVDLIASGQIVGLDEDPFTPDSFRAAWKHGNDFVLLPQRLLQVEDAALVVEQTIDTPVAPGS